MGLPLDAFLVNGFTPSLPAYAFTTTLDDKEYLFDVHWNPRDEAWYFHLLDADESPIRHGIKVVLGAALGGTCADDRFPDGAFFAVDTSGQGLDAGIDDLGARVLVYFFPRATLDEPEAAQ